MPIYPQYQHKDQKKFDKLYVKFYNWSYNNRRNKSNGIKDWAIKKNISIENLYLLCDVYAANCGSQDTYVHAQLEPLIREKLLKSWIE